MQDREFDRRQARDLMNAALDAKAVVTALEKALDESLERRDRVAAELLDAETSLAAGQSEYRRHCDTIGELLAARNKEGVRWSSPHDGREYAALLDSDGVAVVGRVVSLGVLIGHPASIDSDDDDPIAWPCLCRGDREPAIVGGVSVAHLMPRIVREVDDARDALSDADLGDLCRYAGNWPSGVDYPDRLKVCGKPPSDKPPHAFDRSSVPARINAKLGDPKTRHSAIPMRAEDHEGEAKPDWSIISLVDEEGQVAS